MLLMLEVGRKSKNMNSEIGLSNMNCVSPSPIVRFSHLCESEEQRDWKQSV